MWGKKGKPAYCVLISTAALLGTFGCSASGTNQNVQGVTEALNKAGFTCKAETTQVAASTVIGCQTGDEIWEKYWIHISPNADDLQAELRRPCTSGSGSGSPAGFRGPESSASAQLVAASALAITAKVIDSAGNGIPNVGVTIQGPVGFKQSGITNGQGTLEVAVPRAGAYSVELEPASIPGGQHVADGIERQVNILASSMTVIFKVGASDTPEPITDPLDAPFLVGENWWAISQLPPGDLERVKEVLGGAITTIRRYCVPG